MISARFTAPCHIAVLHFSYPATARSFIFRPAFSAPSSIQVRYDVTSSCENDMIDSRTKIGQESCEFRLVIVSDTRDHDHTQRVA